VVFPLQGYNHLTIINFNAAKPFPRNASRNFAKYLTERPEMISHNEESKTAKTTEGK
jgi:predicted methyltransferase